MQEALARLTGKSNELLSYEEVAQKLKLKARAEKGLFNIPLTAIIGSVGRYHDFSRSFLPLTNNEEEKQRWARVKALMDDPAGPGWPPIEVYKVGDVYFVLDGNHRVSVARQEGFSHIEAHVIEIKTDIPLTADIQPDDLIIKSEYADFLEATDIKILRPNADLSLTVPGQYQKLLEHIDVHRYFMGLDFRRDIDYPEAVSHWYDEVYLSIVLPLRERGLLRWFPNRTETDLYLWVSEHRAMLEDELGWAARPEDVAADLAIMENPKIESDVAETGSWRLNRLADRYTGRLFKEILVPVSGEPGSWQALNQAAIVARYENAELHGLNIIPSHTTEDADLPAAIQKLFHQRCAEESVAGRLVVETGDVPDIVCRRALLTDLIVLNTAHPPEPGLSALGSGLRTIIWRSARPILAVPDKPSQLNQALVAYDGSKKSKEAVFIAAYIAERWNTSLTVLTITDDPNSAIQDYVREYFDLHEISAHYIIATGSQEVFLRTIEENDINLVLMGGYSGNALHEIIIGSAVNFLLRSANIPILICR